MVCSLEHWTAGLSLNWTVASLRVSLEHGSSWIWLLSEISLLISVLCPVAVTKKKRHGCPCRLPQCISSVNVIYTWHSLTWWLIYTQEKFRNGLADQCFVLTLLLFNISIASERKSVGEFNYITFSAVFLGRNKNTGPRLHLITTLIGKFSLTSAEARQHMKTYPQDSETFHLNRNLSPYFMTQFSIHNSQFTILFTMLKNLLNWRIIHFCLFVCLFLSSDKKKSGGTVSIHEPRLGGRCLAAAFEIISQIGCVKP